MSMAVDVLWDHLHGTGVSWLGVYALEGDALVLRARRDRPACSPIGLHGACGRACLEQTSLVIRDVGDLGPAYVACDPRDLSEMVVPLFEETGECWGVFDADSFDRGSFDEHEADEVYSVLREIGLTAGRPPAVVVV